MRRLAVGAAAALTIAVAAAAPRPSAAFESENRAVVVVDTGDGEPRTACVVFREASITGLQALEAARMEPEVYGYAGQGGAVCKLCGVGCPAGSACLTCESPKYWQYWRSDGGAGYTYSNAGAGSTRVEDGDLEGWVWGESRRSPLLVAVETVCADPSRTFRVASPATTTTVASPASSPPPPPASADPGPGTPAAPPVLAPAVPPAPRAPASTAGAGGGPQVPSGGSAAAGHGAPADAGGWSGSEATTPPRQAGPIAGTAQAGGPPPAPHDAQQGSSAAGYVAFAVMLSGLAAASAVVRRNRRKSHLAKGVR